MQIQVESFSCCLFQNGGKNIMLVLFTMAWLLVPDGKILELSHPTSLRIYTKLWNIRKINSVWVEIFFWWEKSQETGQIGLSCLWPWWAENHLRMHNTSNPEADGLQQQRAISGFITVSWKQKSKPIVWDTKKWTGMQFIFIKIQNTIRNLTTSTSFLYAILHYHNNLVYLRVKFNQVMSYATCHHGVVKWIGLLLSEQY